MGDVLAAADVLVHSSAGLTVLEAIIRGCPVVSYGFGVGHVRASNTALERFKLAQVARSAKDLPPAIQRALESHPEPDASFARRPSTASLILTDERRARTMPVWRVRTARAATTVLAVGAVAAWTLTTGMSYKLVSDFVHMRPVTAVTTARPEVGILIDAPQGSIPTLAGALAAEGIHASFTLSRPSHPLETTVGTFGDQSVPRLPKGGLVRWLGTRDELRDLMITIGHRHHFLYSSSGPSVGQWLVAHGAGGRLVAGAVKLDDRHDPLGRLHPGEVIELTTSSTAQLQSQLARLLPELSAQHLVAVSVGRLMHDAGLAA
jgi:hypothetical protein